MPLPRLPFSRRQAAAGVVIALHVGVLATLPRLGAWRDRGPPAEQRAPLVVQLLRPWQPQAEPAAAPPRTVKPAASPQRSPAPTSPLPDAPAALPAEPAPAAITRPAAPPAEPAAPAPPLNLALPRGASAPWRGMRNPAFEDPRSQTARASFESRLRTAMGGDGVWVEERVDLDHVRFRRGNDCVQMTRSRAGQLELAGGAFRNLWAGSAC